MIKVYLEQYNSRRLQSQAENRTDFPVFLIEGCSFLLCLLGSSGLGGGFFKEIIRFLKGKLGKLEMAWNQAQCPNVPSGNEAALLRSATG